MIHLNIQVVGQGLLIYGLLNERKSILYFDSIDDVALWTFKKVGQNDIHLFFENVKQIDTPVDEKIRKITLVNEHQKVTISNKNYEMWVTRAIIFHLENKDIYFKKTILHFRKK